MLGRVGHRSKLLKGEVRELEGGVSAHVRWLAPVVGKGGEQREQCCPNFETNT